MNKKSIILLLFTVLFTLQFYPAGALSSGDYSYRILADGTAEITAWAGTETSVVIPDEIGGAKVSSIGNGAFSYNETIKDVTVPEGVVSVDDHAFGECPALESVTLPESLTWLGDFAFQGDVALQKAALPGGIMRIGDNPFDRCDALEAVELRPDHPFYTAENGILYDLRSMRLITYPAGLKEKTYTVPDWVTAIGLAAFSENAYIREITLPETLTEIKGNPFCGCKSLTDIHIPKRNPVYAVLDKTLYNIQTLELTAYLWGDERADFTVAQGTSSIGQEAFYKHSELKSVTMPDSVTSIGTAAFAQTGLVSVKIPKGVRVLNNSLFSECTDLVSIVLPEGLTAIRNSAFYACPRLRSINLPKSLRTIGYAAFVRCDSLMAIVVPEGVEMIDDYAYAGCGRLTTVSLPKSVISIGPNSFYSDVNLTLTVIRDSYAEQWAEQNNVRYRYEKIKYIDNEVI